MPRIVALPLATNISTDDLLALYDNTGDVTGRATIASVVAAAGGGGGTTLPDQAGNSGKYLTTDGTNLSWGSVSGAGITRSITVTSGSFTAGATANTDYAYLLAGAHVPTLPTAVGNTNRYTFKNNHSANITFLTTSSQTIDGGALVLGPQEAVDLVSNNANWFII